MSTQTQNFLLIALAIIVVGIITDRAIQKGKRVRLDSPWASLDFNNDTPTKRALMYAKA